VRQGGLRRQHLGQARGITAATIDNTLYDAFGQRPIAQLFTPLSQYYVIEEVDPHFQLGPDALQRIYIASQTSGMVPLSEVVTLTKTTAPLGVNQGAGPRSSCRPPPPPDRVARFPSG
jgi:multidrug efflux pump subunit AcrB